MSAEKIRTEKDFINKLDELGAIFGVKFDIDDYDNAYITDSNDKRIKMKKYGEHYFGYIGRKKICFRYLFEPHCFSTSILIEVFSNDGKKIDCCRLEQELTPQSGIKAYPTFTYNTYEKGVTHLFYSNSFMIETAEINGASIHVFDAINRYENDGNIKVTDKIQARFTKPHMSRFLCGIDDGEGVYYPHAEFEIYRGYKGHNYKVWVLSGNCKIYQDISREYKYNPNGFYAMIPFFDCNYINEVQYLEEVNKDITPEEWNNLYLSIIQNKGAIECFENTIDYFEDSGVSTYIYEHFSKLIDSIKGLQGTTRNESKSLMKTLESSVPHISD